MDASSAPAWLSANNLAAPVRRMLASEIATVERWSGQRLTGGSSDALGVWRLAGSAFVVDKPRRWSLILKGFPAPAPGFTPDGMSWPTRELDLYTTGLLAHLPGGIAAPACFGNFRRLDGSVWIWIEDLASSITGPWPLERYTSFARHLGQFNGAWLNGRPMPTHPSLSQGWIRHRVEAAAPFIDELQKLGAHPMVRTVFSPRVAAAFVRLWNDRERQLASLARLPHTFCHLDAFPRNTFIRTGIDGREEAVLIDWDFAGIAALGEELASLIVASVIFMEVPLEAAPALEDAVLEGYIDGLRDAGWRGDPETVHEGYRIAATLRYGIGGVARWIPLLTTETPRPESAAIINRPREEVFANVIGVQEWMARLCHQA